jgi:hypothetical protein
VTVRHPSHNRLKPPVRSVTPRARCSFSESAASPEAWEPRLPVGAVAGRSGLTVLGG